MAFHRSAENGHLNVVLGLSKLGTDLNATTCLKKTPCHLAVKTRHSDVIEVSIGLESILPNFHFSGFPIFAVKLESL